MNENDFYGIDLNLLKAFRAIYQEASITSAAERQRLGQSAMSHALARLRVLFDDELFVRGPQGMEPTQRAREIMPLINNVMGGLEEVFKNPPKFDPARDTHHFTIAMSDYFEAIFLPDLLAQISQQSKNVTMSVAQLDLDEVGKRLDDDKIDMALGFLPNISRWHEPLELYHERRLCVYSPKQVDIKGRMKLSDYVKHRHVVRSLAGRSTSFVDDVLKSQGLTRQVLLATPHYSTMPGVLMENPLIATVPARLVSFFEKFSDLAACELPFDAPQFSVRAVWHARNNKNPALKWLQALVVEIVGAN